MKLILIGLTGLCVVGCGQRGATVDARSDGGQTVTIADQQSGTLRAELGAGPKMPTDLPLWAPQYPGSTILVAQVQSQSASHGPLENVTMQTPDSLSKVNAFYDRKIAEAGIKAARSAGTAEASSRIVETATGMISVGVVKNDDGGSLISIVRIKAN